MLEIMSEPPDLVVSGINYGENITTGITISGTVGAAIEAASFGIPSLAISLETQQQHHLSYSSEVDFSTAAHFTEFFSRLLLKKSLPEGMDLIKVDIPSNATPQTRWEWTRLSRQRYYRPVKPERSSWDVPGLVGYEMVFDFKNEPEDSDAFVLHRKRLVSVTPLTLDLTAHISIADLEQFAASQ
jgi:5'-nucleotidase